MSIKKNFGYNLTLTFCNYLFPLLVYPYISRVLGVANIGTCGFIDGIIEYFIIFSMGGISTYGIREIARNKDDEGQLSMIFSSLITINLILTLLAVAVLVVSIYTIPKFHDYKPFLWWGCLKLIFNIFLIEWFYQGMEQFKYITMRSIIVRTLFVASVFIFVHNQADVIIYYSLTVLTVVLNASINWRYSRRWVKLSFRALDLRPFLASVMAFGVYRILTSLYTTFNMVFLGFVTDSTQVGYFATASKLYAITISVITALSMVMIPQISQILKRHEYDRLNSICDRFVKGLLAITLPLIFYCVIFAHDIVYLIAGNGYEGAVTPFRIIISLILVIGLEQVFIMQLLMASTESNRPIILISSVGAAVGLTLNFMLTPRMGAVGSCISWVSVEVILLILGVIIAKRVFNLHLDVKAYKLMVLKSLVYIVPLLAVAFFSGNIWVRIPVSAVTALALFIMMNFVGKTPDEMPVPIDLKQIIGKIAHHK